MSQASSRGLKPTARLLVRSPSIHYRLMAIPIASKVLTMRLADVSERFNKGASSKSKSHSKIWNHGRQQLLHL